MSRFLLLALAAVALPAAGHAQTMNAESFHARATALKKKGPMALFSGGEIKKLMAEGQAAGKAAGARYDADKKAGRPTRFCPPPGKREMGSTEFMKQLSAIPVADRRRIDMTEAMLRILTAKYPCAR
ncbi:hypothetical protein [Sphingomonas sp. LY160]|uniref:hypothetical protein n=1 Tax=Sphingomonas sp. LY160 TaxID=3095342 RepID=UPI002ADEAE02|nr:hypothetical protein [Sphingomonas sp. LY160]MEA1072084.1 hypothetical protein [Sphingomonas sp. LY160]